MVVEELSNYQAMGFRFALDLAKVGKLGVPIASYYQVNFCAKALLVDPVNGNPYVFVEPSTKFCFNGSPGNGTDKLRQRMLAGVFFNRLKSAAPELQIAIANQEKFSA